MNIRALHFRSVDRNLNQLNYPRLHYPEIYILKGGYRDFFESYSVTCKKNAFYNMFRNDVIREDTLK